MEYRCHVSNKTGITGDYYTVIANDKDHAIVAANYPIVSEASVRIIHVDCEFNNEEIVKVTLVNPQV